MIRKIALIFFVSTTSVLLAVSCGGGGTEAPPAESAGSAGGGAAAPAADVPSGSARITGTIQYQGDVPNLRPITMDADPVCAAKHTEPVQPEILVLGPGNTLANVFVKVKSGLPEVQWPAPSQPVVLDQKGCQYDPHVLGVLVGQTLKILNSDGLLHNVHALPSVNREFNIGMPATRTEAEHVFNRPEEMFMIKCDVHPWMGAYVSVMTHPFFAVSGKDGKYTISGLPAGTYEIEAWHERLGTQTASVTVADGETQTADFSFSPPSR